MFAGQPAEIAARRAMVDLMIGHEASVIDTSPEYYRAEEIIGEVIAPAGRRSRLFLATKVWSDGRRAGERQMQRSAQLMGTETVDLMEDNLGAGFGPIPDAPMRARMAELFRSL